MAITTEMRTQVLELYTAYFNRVADKAGVDYWTNEMDTKGWTIDQVAQSFADQTEYKDAYAGKTNEEIVDAVYNNVLNRAADADGKTYWVDELTAGTMSVKNLIQAVVDAAKEDKDGLGDDDVLANKTTVSEYAYEKGLDEAAAKAIKLDAITADASSVATVEAAVDTAAEAAEAAANAAETFALTASAGLGEYQSIKDGGLFTGTEKDDTFLASAGQIENAIIQAGEGRDTIKAAINATDNNASLNSTDLEVAMLRATATTAIDLADASGLELATNDRSTAGQTLTLKNVALDTQIGIKSTTSTTTVTYADVSGTDDTALLRVDAAGTTATAANLNMAGIETLSILAENNASYINTNTTTNTSMTKILVQGDQNVNLGTLDATITTVDASNLTGDLTVTEDTAATHTMTGGAGDDKFTLAHFTAGTDTVDGGAGTNTLATTYAKLNAINADVTKVSNIQAIESTDVITGAIDVRYFGTDVTTVNLAAGSNNGSLTLNAGTNNINILGTKNAGALTVTDGTSTATDDVVNFATTQTVTAFDAFNGQALTSTGIETVNIDTTDALSADVTATIGAVTITADTGGTATLNISGADSITTGVITADVIDVSGLTAQALGTDKVGGGGTGAVTTFSNNNAAAVVATTDGTLTITGSAGNDIIVGDADDKNVIDAGAGHDTIVGGSANDTITAGDGWDKITTNAGDDTVDAGAGNDTIIFGANLSALDKLDGGEGTDTLVIDNTSVIAVNALSVSQINTLNANINNINILDFGADLAQNIDMGRLDNIENVTMSNLGADVTLSGLSATNKTTITGTTGQKLTLELADDAGTSDVINLEIKNDNAINVNTINASNIETINISGVDATTAASSNINTMALEATKATSIVVTGNDGLTLTNTGNTKVTNFDASGVAANDASDTAANMAVTFTSANTSTTAHVAITGGEGNDVLQGNVGIDTINGGKGADKITVTAGNDVVDGGEGNDTVIFTDALFDNNSETTATHTGGEGTDILSISDAASIVDADFARLSSFETLQLANATNSVTLGAEADTTGIVTIIGGTGADTIDASSVDFDNVVTIAGGTGRDVITGNTDVKTIFDFNAITDVIATSGLTIADTDSDGSGSTKEEITNANTLDLINWTDGKDIIDLSGIDATAGGTDDAFTAVVIDNTAVAGSSDAIAADPGNDHKVTLQTGVWDATNGDFTHTANGADALMILDDGSTIGAVVVVGGATLEAGDFIL